MGDNRARIHTFIATSALHMEKKLRMSPEQVLEQARLSVRFARNLCDDIEFSPEDGSRSDVDFLCWALEVVIAEGATTINVPDTVGYALPQRPGDGGGQFAGRGSRSAAPARWSARSTGWASGPAIVRSRKS